MSINGREISTKNMDQLRNNQIVTKQVAIEKYSA